MLHQIGYVGLDAVWVPGGDTVAAFDSGLRRVTRFRTGGPVVATQTYSFPLGSPAFLAAFDDGDIAAAWVRIHLDVSGRPIPRRESLVSDTLELARLGPEGEMSSLGFGLGFRRYGDWNDPLSPTWQAAARGDTLFYTDGMSVVWVRGEDGSVVREIPLPRLSIDPGTVWDSVVRAVEARHSEPRSEAMRNVPRHDLVPRISRMLLDDRGLLWVKRFEPRDAAVLTNHLWWNGGEWLVLDGEGRLVATLKMPDELMPLEIAGDRILGFYRDELNVERIRVYAIDRTARGVLRP